MLLRLHTFTESSRKFFALLLMLALLTPVFVGLLPTPALSAEQQLLFDLGQNICSQNQDGTDQHKSMPEHGQCCILCAPQIHLGASEAESSATTFTRPEASILVQLHNVESLPRAPPDLRATSPRAPPTALSI